MNRPALEITLLSPYHGGSHRAWAEGLARHSRHRITILSLPAQFWKWRMHGAALPLAERFRHDIGRADLLVATDMLDLGLFLSRTRDLTATTPALLYAHENQLTYPLPEDPHRGPMRRQLGERDRHYAWVNVTSMLVADAVRFNSRFHREQFLAALPGFLNHFPDAKDPGWVDQIRQKSDVLAPGIDLRRLGPSPWPGGPGSLRGRTAQSAHDGPPTGDGPLASDELLAGDGPSSADEPLAGDGPSTGDELLAGDLRSGQADPSPPVLLWNQRWEYDKDPEAFFSALDAVTTRGGAFRLIVCGENPRQSPEEFDAARARFADRILHWGVADDARYAELLRRSDVVVSTARHEYFGIAVVEAMSVGAFPILPNRLNYPDLVPEELRPACLYRASEDLVDRLLWALAHPGETKRLGQALRKRIWRCDWSEIVASYDALFEKLVEEHGFR